MANGLNLPVTIRAEPNSRVPRRDLQCEHYVE
jgi:hypothetical protein